MRVPIYLVCAAFLLYVKAGQTPNYDRRIQPLDLTTDQETVSYLLPKLTAKYRSNTEWNGMQDPRFYVLTEMEKNDMDYQIKKIGTISGFGVAHAQSLSYSTRHEHEQDFTKATREGENYLSQLICMLRTLILETSIEYQECLIKQIEMTKMNTKIGPVGSHWDELTSVRIKGTELKDELHRFEALAKNIGEIVEEQDNPVLLENELVLKSLNNELLKLQKLCDIHLKEIRKFEKELLEANRDSILYDQISNE
ncbi:hypothetical protein FQA39_LY08357 [Lamprigera yunnana]|nr:hypothetical protein FQA39_LY08357 [Lamprigera yunnana]